jgi:fucose permease
MTERGRPRHRAGVAAIFFVNGTLFATWVSRIPDVREALALSEARLGLALLAMGAGTFAALPVSSWLIARYGSLSVVRASAIACCLAVPLAGRAPSLPLLAAALALFGATLGTMDVAMNAQAAQLERGAGRSLMSTFHGLWSFGGLAGASLGGAFAARAYAPAIHFMAVSMALALISLGAAGHLLREDGALSPTASLAWPSRPVLIIGLVGACGAVIEGGIADWSGIYLRQALGASAAFATAGYAAFSVAMMAGRFAGDRLIDRFGQQRLLRGGSALTGAALVAGLLGGNAALAVAAFACAGLGMSTVFPIAFSAAGSLRGTTPGHAIAAVATMAYGGGLLGPPLIGFAATATSLSIALWLLVVACALIAALAGRVTAAS